WNPTTLFDASSRTLYQAWGTNLLAEEFHQPVHGSVRSRSILFWVGSVWNNASNQGNLEQIADLKRVIADRGKKFVKVRFIPNWMNSALMRRSFLAPAIAGGWQVDHDYLPCRMFKNISYGQLGLSNVTGFKLILGDATMEANSIAELIDRALS